MEQPFPDPEVRRTLLELRKSIWNRCSADIREGLEDRRRILRLKAIPVLSSDLPALEAALLAFERTLVEPNRQSERGEVKARLITQIDQLLAKLAA